MRTPFQKFNGRDASNFRPSPDLLTMAARNLARRPFSILAFARTLTTTSQYLFSNGALATEIPMPHDGAIITLGVWTGTAYVNNKLSTTFNAGDRISCYAQHGSSVFQVKARINGVTVSSLAYTPENRTYLAIIGVILAAQTF